MCFDYNQYCRVNLWRPLQLIIVGVIGLVVFVFPQIAALISNPQEYLHLLTPIFGAGTILLSFVFLCGHPLWNGGYRLLWEKPKDVICIGGKIESISECSAFRSLNYHTAQGPSQGYEITVNGVAYLAMDRAQFYVGNQVVIVVLPQSKIILSIMRAEENDAES